MLNDEIDRLKDNMSNTAKAAIEAANGGVVALDKLNKGFNWAALGAAALNAAVNFGLSVLLSAAVSWIDAFNHRVERAQQATAVYKISCDFVTTDPATQYPNLKESLAPQDIR